MVWVCPKCLVSQNSSEVRTMEIVEPGKNPRVEFYGRIRPEGSQDGPLAYTCLVCGHVWDDGPEDPTPGGASTRFLHPITEQSSCCVDGCVMCNRDAC